MMDRRLFLAGAAGAAAVASARAEPLAASSKDLAGDIRILREAFETLHPGLYRYLSPAEAAAGFARLEAAWAVRPTLETAYLDLSRFLATVRCGHTYANFYNQSDSVAAALFSGKTRLPFHFRWIDGRMVVVANQSGDERLTPGTEVVTVNGVKARRLLPALKAYARADGGNDAKREALLEAAGEDSYETFDIFHALAYGPIGDALALKVRDGRTGTTARLDVATINLATRRQSMNGGTDDPERMGWSFVWPEERIGLLTMPNWEAYKTKWDWRGWLDTVFAELADRRATGLIVDLRRNEGGNDCGNEILARLVNADLRLESYDRRVRYLKTPAALDPYLDTWDDSFRDRTADATPYDDRFYALKASDSDDDISLIRPKGPRFHGKTAILISPTNSSATFSFANAIKSNGLATLIGEPTGGNLRGINGGNYFFVRLPASGLEVDLPLIGYFPHTPKPDAGVEPDIKSPLTRAAVISGRDPAMEAAMAHIRA
jgi:hypothetical protein